jgi:urease accessory protein
MRNLLIAALALGATPALAHHPLGGLPMETFAHGLLSGAGHPVLGFDHLFFVALMGVAALFTARRLATPLAYIGAMLVGTLAISSGVVLPGIEFVVALSLLALGAIVLSGRALGMSATLVVFAGFGLFHGAAFGGSIAGQEGGVGGAVLLGYLIGLGAIQYGIALAAGWVAERVLGVANAAAVNARLVGAMVAGVGAFLVLEALEGPLLGVLFGA